MDRFSINAAWSADIDLQASALQRKIQAWSNNAFAGDKEHNERYEHAISSAGGLTAQRKRHAHA